MNEAALIKTLQGHGEGAQSPAFSPSGKFLAAAGKDNTIRLWDSPDDIEIQVLMRKKPQIFSEL